MKPKASRRKPSASINVQLNTRRKLESLRYPCRRSFFPFLISLAVYLGEEFARDGVEVALRASRNQGWPVVGPPVFILVSLYANRAKARKMKRFGLKHHSLSSH